MILALETPGFFLLPFFEASHLFLAFVESGVGSVGQ
jgi:hypothetical protein